MQLLHIADSSLYSLTARTSPAMRPKQRQFSKDTNVGLQQWKELTDVTNLVQ